MNAGWEEVERMAQAADAADAVQAEEYPTDNQIARWRKLFKYTEHEAAMLIRAQRSDVTRTRITDEHWELVREEREAAGHDRETYEHEQQLRNVLRSQSAIIPSASGDPMFVIRLGGLLSTAEKVKEVAGLEEMPKVVNGMSEMGMASFCLVDGKAKKAIDEWLAQAQVRA